MTWWWLLVLGCRGVDQIEPPPPPLGPTGDTGPVTACPAPDPEVMRLEADIQFDVLDPCALEPAATQLCDLRHHAVGRRDDIPWRDELFLFLPPGPGEDTLRIRRWAVFAGFRTLVLGYVNDGDLSVACRGTDGACHAAWREETNAGVDASPHVEVGPTDGIEVRLLAALTHLAREDPDRRWSDFLTPSGDVWWSRVVASGWSIGAGQAAYLAHARPLAGVVLLSGPKDQATVQGVDGPAPWIAGPMQVPGERLFGVYHADEEGAGPPNDLLSSAWSSMGMPQTEYDHDGPSGELVGAHRVRLSRSMEGFHPACDPHGSVGRDLCMSDDLMAPYVTLMCAAAGAATEPAVLTLEPNR